MGNCIHKTRQEIRAFRKGQDKTGKCLRCVSTASKNPKRKDSDSASEICYAVIIPQNNPEEKDSDNTSEVCYTVINHQSIKEKPSVNKSKVEIEYTLVNMPASKVTTNSSQDNEYEYVMIPQKTNIPFPFRGASY
ncbi:PREDICTED: germinal center-associated signaling and motility protein isoform X2 [Gavialis gangeticus]|uniref:germinal center-associated signaling and motility protein isoform X2 n=1 Tax=Gavialis gangeticus TaxID=94835 RepID=UPI00092FCA8C|nr:PREDICTED: germinal center-associated signaling and motility protein isoform X2 [Gavialis gangeticus]